jgi:hypothetical protein
MIKKFLIIFSGFLIFAGIVNKAEAKVNVGIVSAVKNKVKQLKDKKDKDQQKVQYKLSSNTIILSADTNSKFLGVSSDSTIYRYESTASEIATLQPGKIIISTQGEGYLRKVVSVAKVGSEYQVQTTTAALNEAFEMLNIEFHKTITPSDMNTQSIKLPKGASLKPSVELGTWVLNLDDVMFSSGNTNISINGTLSFTPTVDLIIDMPNPWTLNKFYFNVGIEQESHLGLRGNISYNTEKTLFKFPLGTYAIGPVIVTPMYRFNVGVEVNISGDVGFSINGQSTLSGGLGCDSNCLNTNNWLPHSDFSRSFSIGQSTMTAQGEFKGYIAPEISFKAYGVVGPYLKAKFPFVDLTINLPLNHLPWSLDVGIGAYAGLELSIDAWFMKIGMQKEVDLFESSWTLASGVVFNNKPVISSFTITPQNPVIGSNVTIQCNATDSDNDTLSYNWSATGGILSSTTTNPVTWTAPNTAGTYTINVTVSDDYGGFVHGITNVQVGTNSSPKLSWTGEANYTSDGLNPETGNTSTTFVYRIKYTDADNDPPASGYPKLHIKKGGVEISGSPFTMTEVDSSDTNYTDGKLYVYSTTLPAGTDYTYYFEAKDSKGANATPTIEINSPDVIQISGGTKLWTKQWGFTDDDIGKGVAVDSSGNIYVTGYRYNTSNGGYYEGFLIKYDPNGNILWTAYSGKFNNGIAIDNISGNIYVTGTDNSDAYLMKYNSSGSLIWAKWLNITSEDVAEGVATDGSGNIYITGYIYTDSSYEDIFLSKYDTNGNLKWTRQLGTIDFERAHAVATDISGNIYITGYTESGLDGNPNNDGLYYDIFLTKYDTNGNKIWTKQLGTSADDEAYSITTDSYGNIYVTGRTWGSLGGTNAGNVDIFLAKYDASGGIIWIKQLGTNGNDEGRGIVVDSSGNIYITGETSGNLDGNVNAGIFDAFLSKYDTNGNKLWTKLIGTNADDEGRGIAVDTFGNIYITGWTEGGLDGNINAGKSDVFLTKFSP